jgi:GT2 family glycosyltransferase
MPPEYLTGPCAVTVLDLDRALAALDLGLASDGQPYRWLRALVRLHGDTLATIEAPVVDGRVETSELSEWIWQAAGDRLLSHVQANGCVPVSILTRQALIAGLPAPRCNQRDQSAGRPFVSVVVLTAGRTERLAHCIRSIVDLSYPDFELVIVDNAPESGSTRELVAQWARARIRVRYITEPVRGVSRARNRGIASTEAGIVAFTDDDVMVDQGWIERIVAPFLEDEQVGVVTGLVIAARLETIEERRFEHFSGFARGLDVLTFDTDQHRPPSQPLFPYWGAAFGATNNVAFRRAVLEEIGGFDEALGYGTPARSGADIDVFTRALLSGARLIYEPRAVCWHYHRADAQALRRQVFNYAAGATAVLTKWSLRDRGLVWRFARMAGSALLPTRGGPGAATAPREADRFRQLLRMSHDQGVLLRQLAGFALGPFLYVQSARGARRDRPWNAPTAGTAPRPAPSPSVLLITVTDGSPNGAARVLEQMLDSLADQAHSLDVIMVIRGDRVVSANNGTRLQTLRAPLATGVSHARNLALRHAQETGLLRDDQIVGFPDDDCAYPPGLLRSVAGLMIETGADVVCGAFAPAPEMVDAGRFPPRRIELTPRLVPALASSATMFFTGAVVDEVGLFDERFGLGARFGATEDQDYVMRAMRAGFRAVYDPNAVFVRHPYKAHRWGEYYAGSMALLAKHAWPVPRLGVSLGYRLITGLGRVISGRLPLRHYLRGVRAAASILWTATRHGNQR